MYMTQKKMQEKLRGFERNLTKTHKRIEDAYRDGSFDFKIQIGGVILDLKSCVPKLIAPMKSTAGILDNMIEKRRLNYDNIKLGNRVKMTVMEIIDLIQGDVTELHSFGSGCENYEQYIEIFNGEEEIYEAFTVASIESCRNLAVKKGSLYTMDETVFHELILVYLMTKNGYVDTLGIVEESRKKLEENGINMSKGCTYEDFCTWMNSVGINVKLFESYIRLFIFKFSIIEAVDKSIIDGKGEDDVIEIDGYKYVRDFDVANLKGARDDRKLDGSKLVVAYQDKAEIVKELISFMNDLNREFKRAIKAYPDRYEQAEEIKTEVKSMKTVKRIKKAGLDIADIISFHILNDIDYDYMIGYALCLAGIMNKDTINGLGQQMYEKMKSMVSVAELVLAENERLRTESLALSNDLTKLRIRSDKDKEISKQFKSKSKQLEKDIKELESKYNTQKSKNEKQIAYIESLKNQGITNAEPYKEEIAELKEKLNRQHEDVDRLKRENKKLKDLKADSDAKVSELTTSLEKAVKQTEVLKEQMETTVSATQGNGIALECYINAISDKKVAVYGGNMMHAELRKLGIKNLRLFEADERNISYNDLAHQDLIVVVTGYMAHSTMHIPKGAAEKHNIPIYYFNNKNVTMLIQEIFEALYKEQSTENKLTIDA